MRFQKEWRAQNIGKNNILVSNLLFWFIKIVIQLRLSDHDNIEKEVQNISKSINERAKYPKSSANYIKVITLLITLTNINFRFSIKLTIFHIANQFDPT